ncbi:short-chain dehydrogenase reductase sdr [Nannochloropsis oceanica]
MANATPSKSAPQAYVTPSPPAARSSALFASSSSTKTTKPEAVGELYRFRVWHTALLLTLAFLLDIPFLIDRLTTKQYTVHTKGGVLITGASTGIGRDAAVALAIKHKGFVVYAGVRNGKDAKAISGLNIPNLLPVTLDVTNERSINSAKKIIMKDLASKGDVGGKEGGGGAAAAGLPLVAVVNNAGIAGRSPLEFHAMAAVEKIFHVNVFGLLRVTQVFLPEIRKNKGRIINISSVLGALTIADMGAYSASKHAMESLSDGLRRELRPLGVSVSIVQPGIVVSAIHDKVASSSPATSSSDSSPSATTYPHMYTPEKQAEGKAFLQQAASTRVTTAAILDSLFNPRPRTRYPVAAVGPVPAGLLTFNAYFLPDRITDWMMQ